VLEPDQAEGDKVKSEAWRIQLRPVAADDPRLFKLAHPPQAWRRRDAHARRQIDIGHAPVILQFTQDLEIDHVEVGLDHHGDIPVVASHSARNHRGSETLLRERAVSVKCQGTIARDVLCVTARKSLKPGLAHT